MFTKLISNWTEKTLEKEGLNSEIKVDRPKNFEFGDYTSNLAMVEAKKQSVNPMELAEKFTKILNENLIDEIEKVEVVAPGFLNFFIKDKILFNEISKIVKADNVDLDFEDLKGKKVVVEYTDPNPFKELHIGHLMTNTIGEALSNILERVGAEVKRVCYQGDVGMHVAKAIYGALKQKETGEIDWDKVYQLGAGLFEENEEAKKEITILNKKIYSREDSEINALYDEGRKYSLKKFEKMYGILGTKFDHYFFESEVGKVGEEMVRKNIGKIFTESDGAVIFEGDKYDLHNRVFINSEGLPIYEAKELGLSKIKAERFPADLYIVVTGNEINEYFKVLKKVISFFEPELSEKIYHLGHGMLRLPTGKMASRKGQVITVEDLLNAVKRLVLEKVNEKDWEKTDLENLTEKIAVGAVKYSILKQSIGGDIIFDFEKSISFEGDSGPYLNYSYARAESILRNKNPEKQIEVESLEKDERELANLLIRIDDSFEKTTGSFSAHFIIQYLIETASAFNKFYAGNKILGSGEDEERRLVLTKAFSIVLENGLRALGIPVLDRM